MPGHFYRIMLSFKGFVKEGFFDFTLLHSYFGKGLQAKEG